MIRSTISTLLVLTAIPSFSQTPTEVSSTIQAVTVYPRGAQIERHAEHRVNSGRHILTFTDLATELDPATISVSGGSTVTVLSVSTQRNYLNEQERPKHIKNLEDSLRTYEFDAKFNQNMLAVFGHERSMILANKQLAGEEGSFVIEDLEDLSDFYRDRLADIMLKEMEIQTKQEKIYEEINRLNAQLAEYKVKADKSTGEILVEVYAKAATTAKFTIKYMVRNAGWSPTYNVNVSDVNNPVDLVYNANVSQSTGIDWSNVDLILTNANPNLSGSKPELHPWRLYFVNVQNEISMLSNRRYKMEEEVPSAAGAYSADFESLEEFQIGSTINYPVNEAAIEFRIKSKQSIPSNGKDQKINIDQMNIDAAYEYYCAPKVDPTAFLIAKIQGFEKFNLLPGEANLFLSNTFVGKAYINPDIVDDTLDLSLGRDQSIVIERKRIDDFSATKKIGSSTKETIGLEISMRNTKSSKIKLIVEDQVPISSDKDISVDVEELSGAKRNEKTGIISWELEIPSNTTVSKQFRYSVKYPSDRKINL